MHEWTELAGARPGSPDRRGASALDPRRTHAQLDPVIRRHPRLFSTLVLGVLASGAAVFRLTPLWPGPGLPTGATRLHIETTPAHLVPTFACQTALLAPARIVTVGDELVLISSFDAKPVKVVWPSGWAAWRLDGRAELVDRDGAIVGREGETLEGLGGGVGVDDAFHVCVIGS